MSHEFADYWGGCRRRGLSSNGRSGTTGSTQPGETRLGCCQRGVLAWEDLEDISAQGGGKGQMSHYHPNSSRNPKTQGSPHTLCAFCALQTFLHYRPSVASCSLGPTGLSKGTPLPILPSKGQSR